MSQADDLLMTVEDAAVVHSHNVADPDSHFVIDPDTRLISNLSNTPNKLMQNDHNSEIYTFEIPCIIEGHDMMNCNRVRLHYINIENGGKQQWDDVAELTLEAGGVNGTLISKWLIPRTATQYAGSLNFLLQFECVDDGGNVVYDWHTDVYKDVLIAPTFANYETVIIPYTNILEEWYQRLFGVKDSVIADIQTEAANQLSTIEAKGQEVLDTIPDDYTEANRLAHDSVRTRANAIVRTAEGSVIKLTDSSDDHVRGLTIKAYATQLSTTGTQLFDCGTLEGVGSNTEIRIFEDGYTIVAFGGDTVGYAFSRFPMDVSKCAGRILIMQVDSITGQSQVGVMLYAFKDGTSMVNYTIKPGQTRVECLIPAAADDVIVYIYTNTVGTPTASRNTVTIKGLRVGYADAPFETYSAGYPSPSPDYPQPFRVVSNPTIYIHGKNLLNVTTGGVATGVTETVKDGLVSFSGTATGSGGRVLWKRSEDVRLLPGTYTLSMKVPSGIAPDACLTRSDTSQIFALCGSVTNNTVTVVEPTTVYLGFNYIADRVYNAKNVSVQLEVGDKATDHVKFRPIQSKSCEMADSFCSGELDLTHGKVTYSPISITPTTGWEPGRSPSGWVHGLDNIGAETIPFHYYLGVSREGYYPETLCTHFPAAESWSEIVSAKTEMAYRGNTSGIAYMAIRIKRSRLIPHGFTDTNDAVNASEAFHAWLEARQLDPKHGKVTFVGPLTTYMSNIVWDPTTYQTDTVIRNDAGSDMSISYNADTMTFLRDHQPDISNEQIQASVDAWLAEHFATAEGVKF